MRNGTLKRLAALMLAAAAILQWSCHLFEPVDETQYVSVYFDESNVSVFKGGLGSLSLRIDPPDSLPYYTVDYEISNEQIATVYRADRRGVIFYGKESGSTVITAVIGNAEAKAVINVIDE